MERNVTIDGKVCRLVANGATPRRYRSMFGKDVFAGITNAVSASGEVNDSEFFENLAYCMAVQGGLTDISIDDWLGSMTSPMAIFEAVPEIMELWTAETETTSKGKKE